MPKIIIKIFFTILLLMHAFPVFAATFDWRRECGDLNSDPSPEKMFWQPLDRKCRIAFAQNLEHSFEQMGNIIPNLSPKEKEWLETEIESNVPARFENAIRSTEYAKKTVKDIFNSVHEHASAILKPDIRWDNELWHWAMVLDTITHNIDYDSYISALVRNDVIEASQLSFYDSCEYKGSYQDYASCIDVDNHLYIEMIIYRKIIMPSIAGKE